MKLVAYLLLVICLALSIVSAQACTGMTGDNTGKVSGTTSQTCDKSVLSGTSMAGACTSGMTTQAKTCGTSARTKVAAYMTAKKAMAGACTSGTSGIKDC